MLAGKPSFTFPDRGMFRDGRKFFGSKKIRKDTVLGTNKEEEKGIWFSHLVLFPALLRTLLIYLIHTQPSFFSPVFVFVFVFVFFFIVYIQVQTARLSEQILVFVLLDNNNNKTTKKKLSRLVSLVRKRANKCPITKGYSMDYLI